MKSKTVFRPGSTSELSEFLISASSAHIAGYWNRIANDSQVDTEVDLSGLAGIVEFSPSDQVVRVCSGTTIGDFNLELKSAGQTIPIFMSYVGEPWGAWDSQTIADCLAWNLPHGLEGQHGSWRDWILGATIVGADGMVYKSGSSVVKSVAGYDIHRLMIGARHTLGIVTEVTLRTAPLSTIRDSQLEIVSERRIPTSGSWRIQRCLRSDWKALMQASADLAVALDPAMCTAFCPSNEDEAVRFPSDRILETGTTAKYFAKAETEYMQRAKKAFDPTYKLNPGAMGIF